MNKELLLSQTFLFENISPSNLKTLASICLPKNIRKKEMVFHEGERGFSLYILVTGSIRLYKTAPDGREIGIKIVKAGEIFAEVILFEKDRYPVNATALKNSFLFMVPKYQFLCLLKNDDFMKDFIGILLQKMRYLTKQIQYLSLHDVEDRLFRFFKEQYGERKEFSPTISKKDIAKAIGTTPETLSRLLLRLKNEKKIQWEQGKITLSNATIEEL